MPLFNYSKTSPCPICGRYKSAYQNKCHGFITSDGVFAYCSREISEGQDSKTIKTHYGKKLYRHRLGEPPLLKSKPKEHKPLFPSATRSIKPSMSAKGGKPKTFTKSLQSPKEKWDAEGNMQALEKIIRQNRLAGKWPYP